MDVDSIVIGAGVVGLAIARELASSGREVIVLERHLNIGQETSARNSEVIHAGIYYPRGSLKAVLCVRGRELLYEYCKSRRVSHRRVGKLIVATSVDQHNALEAIYHKGLANGVSDLRFISQHELNDMEPELAATKAIFSPSTGIVSCHELMLALQADLEGHNGVIALGSSVTSGRHINGGFELTLTDGERITCRELINSAGLHAQALSRKIDGIPPASIPPTFYSKGCYFSLKGKAPFSRLIYPLPSEEGLGVHLTLDLAGAARFGPDTSWVDSINYSTDSADVEDFYKSIKLYYPKVCIQDLSPDYAGIRPKIVGPGAAAADFEIQSEGTHGIKGFVGLYGIESPGLTCSMAIAEVVLQSL